MTEFYDDNAAYYFDATVDVDMTALRSRFLAYVPANGHILDAGCGSGRDSHAFLEGGYRITAFDASPNMAALAGEYVGQGVEVLRFQDITWVATFDGIWACASLLHVPRPELPDVLQRLTAALNLGGILYASFKYGSQDRDECGRHFTDLDETGLASVLEQVPNLRCVEQWVSDDRRPGHAHERWLNSILRKD